MAATTTTMTTKQQQQSLADLEGASRLRPLPVRATDRRRHGTPDK